LMMIMMIIHHHHDVGVSLDKPALLRSILHYQPVDGSTEQLQHSQVWV